MAPLFFSATAIKPNTHLVQRVSIAIGQVWPMGFKWGASCSRVLRGVRFRDVARRNQLGCFSKEGPPFGEEKQQNQLYAPILRNPLVLVVVGKHFAFLLIVV